MDGAVCDEAGGEAEEGFVVVVAVGEQHVGPSPVPVDKSCDGRDLVQQRQQLGDVVAVAAGQRHREEDALPVGEDVVLAARPCAVDRAGPASGPRRAARTWEESITARDQSSFFTERSFFSSTRMWRSSATATKYRSERRSTANTIPARYRTYRDGLGLQIPRRPTMGGSGADKEGSS
ncbi:hypothetical protein GCM10010508_42800 [Streptomyces naganishii JCM 4654]|uniref:Uncharacterized protein n=1 Tax=Streptomyces naganishii JCM 4654 TaxID=1306179 RepID=A0A918Y6U3_9ACTN|nr:hypothetical protein GCM10010508_42800 [Streptomyces naganishii JCM 4654]